jgi:hypothetical protein
MATGRKEFKGRLTKTLNPSRTSPQGVTANSQLLKALNTKLGHGMDNLGFLN